MKSMIIPKDYNFNALKKTVPSMRFVPGSDFGVWQKEVRQKLYQLLGMDKFKSCEPDLQMGPITDRETYTDAEFVFQSEEEFYVPCRMLTPKTHPKAFMICLQGHSTGMHISFGESKYPGDDGDIEDGDRNYAIQAVNLGFTAIALEQRNFGINGGTPHPDCRQSSMLALLRGRTTIGERVWDISALVKLINSSFNPDRLPIYIMGNSGGGTASFYAACMDTAISGAMPSCSVCTFEDSIEFREHCVCNYIPGIANYFDMGDLAGLIAPRPYVQVNGKDDAIFLVSGAKKAFEQCQRLYDEAAAPDKCRLVIGGAGHRFYAAEGWKAFFEVAGL